MKRLLAASVVALALGACNDQYGSSKSLSPIPARTVALMSEKGMTKSDPILVRVYKKEAELEVWKKTAGHYALLKSFPICRWSGQLGPKVREGDRQAPEGFYAITPAQMNPNSAYYLSFDTGYPNGYDRAHGRTGSYLMVHGTCSSRGCYAMTDEGIAEVYALARESFAGGQKNFQFQAYPFRMTAANLARYRNDPNMPFWKNLKEGSDHFEVTQREPKVAVCGGRYAFDTVGDGCKPDPTLAPAVAQKDEEDRRQVAELVGKGTPSVRLVYADGGQHESFRSSPSLFGGSDAGSNFAVLDARPGRSLGDVSRPDALAQGPREVAVNEPSRPAQKGSVVVASLQRPAPAVATGTGSPVARTSTSGRTVVASADPEAPILAPATSEPPAKPFYERMLGALSRDKQEPAATVGDPAPASVPLPPKRKEATASGKSAAPPTGKPAKPSPQASAAPTSRHVEAAPVISGAQALGPSTAGFKTN